MTTRSLELAIAEAARPGRGVRGGTTKLFAVVAVAWVSWGCQFLRPFPPQEPFSVCSAALILRRSFVNGSGGGGANVSCADLCLKCHIFRQVRAPDTSKGDANRDHFFPRLNFFLIEKEQFFPRCHTAEVGRHRSSVRPPHRPVSVCHRHGHGVALRPRRRGSRRR